MDLSPRSALPKIPNGTVLRVLVHSLIITVYISCRILSYDWPHSFFQQTASSIVDLVKSVYNHHRDRVSIVFVYTSLRSKRIVDCPTEC